MNLTSPRYSLVVVQVTAFIRAFMLQRSASGLNLALGIGLQFVPKPCLSLNT
jgi:hypothetical protein